MKMNKIYIAVAMALVAVSACSRMDKVPENAGDIRFAAPVQTKSTDAVSTLDVFQIRDWFNSAHYINTTLEYVGSAWDYGNGASYEWQGGSHRFFGWLDSDNTYSTNSFFPGISLSDTTLVIPAKTMNNSVRQYDFLYSYPVTRSTFNNDYSAVPLIFKHLFAQVAINFKISDLTEDTDQPIDLQRVYIDTNFKNRKGATIKFTGADTLDVEYTNIATDGYFATPVDFNIPGYGKGATPIDVLSQVQTTSKSYYYVWPTPAADLAETDVIRVDYVLNGETRHSTFSFPHGTSWEAGNKYQYTITYLGGILKVEESVLPWTYNELSASADEQSVMATWLGWDTSTCTVSGTNVTFATYPDGDPNAGKLKRIHGMFKIYSPTNCTYHINMTQNADKYTFQNGTGVIGTGTGEIAPGATIDFYIIADDADRPAAGQPAITSNMTFTVRASGGRDYSLDSEIQHDGSFTIIIPSM